LWDVAASSMDAGLLARASGRFSGPGVLGRKCSVDVARLAGEAFEAEDRGDIDRAEGCLARALRHAPDAVGLRRAVLRLKAKAGDASGAAALAVGLAEGSDQEDALPTRRVDAADLLSLAARAAHRDPPPEAEALWVRAALEFPPGGPEMRSVAARLHVLDLPQRARDAVLDVLSGGGIAAADAVVAASLEVPDDALLRYLSGRLLFGEGSFVAARDALRVALALGLPPGPLDGGESLFEAEAWKSLGKAATFAGTPDEAREALSRALQLAPYEGDRLVIEEHLARLAGR
jgi:tetratricopeptide (TPR) repeat protein